MGNVIADNKRLIGAIGAGVGGAIVWGSVVGGASYLRHRKKNRKIKRKVKRRNKKRIRRTPYTARKRPDKSRKRIRYTKKGQPYIIEYRNVNGRRRKMARFIKKRGARRAHKLKGGKY